MLSTRDPICKKKLNVVKNFDGSGKMSYYFYLLNEKMSSVKCTGSQQHFLQEVYTLINLLAQNTYWFPMKNSTE